MKIKLSQLRRLVREAIHDTMMAYTEPVPSTPASIQNGQHPAMQQRSQVDNKVNQVVKLLTKQGRHVDANQIKQFVTQLDPQEQLVMTAEQIAAQMPN